MSKQNLINVFQKNTSLRLSDNIRLKKNSIEIFDYTVKPTCRTFVDSDKALLEYNIFFNNEIVFTAQSFIDCINFFVSKKDSSIVNELKTVFALKEHNRAYIRPYKAFIDYLITDKSLHVQIGDY